MSPLVEGRASRTPGPVAGVEQEVMAGTAACRTPLEVARTAGWCMHPAAVRTLEVVAGRSPEVAAGRSPEVAGEPLSSTPIAAPMGQTGEGRVAAPDWWCSRHRCCSTSSQGVDLAAAAAAQTRSVEPVEVLWLAAEAGSTVVPRSSTTCSRVECYLLGLGVQT